MSDMELTPEEIIEYGEIIALSEKYKEKEGRYFRLDLIPFSIALINKVLSKLSETTDEELLFTFNLSEEWTKATKGEGGLMQTLDRYSKEIIKHIQPIMQARLEQARKEERANFAKEIERDLIYEALEFPSGTPVLHLQTNGKKSSEKWQALKGDSK